MVSYLDDPFFVPLGVAHDEQGDGRGAVEEPGGEAEEIDQLTDVTDADHDQRYYTLQHTNPGQSFTRAISFKCFFVESGHVFPRAPDNYFFQGVNVLSPLRVRG